MEGRIKKFVFVLISVSILTVPVAYPEGSGFMVTEFSGMQYKETSKGISTKETDRGNVNVKLISVALESEFLHMPSNHPSVLIVLSGSIELSRPNGRDILSERDVLFLGKREKAVLRGSERQSELLIMNIPKKRKWSIPFLNAMSGSKPGTPFNYTHGQISTPFEGIDQRYFRHGGIEISFLRIAPGAELPENAFLLVLRGNLTGKNGKTAERYDILSVSGEGHTSGPEGCEAIAVLKGSREYAAAHETRMKAYRRLIGDAKPVVVLDGDLLETGLTFTEGPSWMNGSLYFSNYYMFRRPWGSSPEGGLWRYTPGKGAELLNASVQTCGTFPLPNGNMVACDLLENTLVEFTPEGDFVRIIADQYNGIPFGRPNDVVVDNKGGMYFSDCIVSAEEPKQEGTAYYYITPGGVVKRVTEPGVYGFPNGCMLSPDGSVFYTVDSHNHTIRMYDVAPDGTLLNGRPFAEMYVADNMFGSRNQRSQADGMAVDEKGNLFVAHPLGIQIFSPEGEFIGIISFPQGVSHCDFGGDDLSVLYVTSRTKIFAIQTRTRGLKRF